MPKAAFALNGRDYTERAISCGPDYLRESKISGLISAKSLMRVG